MNSTIHQAASANNTACQVNAEFVTDYGRILDQAVAELAAYTNVKSDRLARFRQLRENMLAWILAQRTGKANSIQGTTWSGWGWQPYLDNRDVRIGLLTLDKNIPIPIHDHPGAVGMLVVLEGTVQINHYQLLNTVESDRFKTAQLQLLIEHEFSARQYAFILPNEGDIHSLESVTDSCVVLDMLLTPYDESQRRWYMPVVEEIKPGVPFTAFCLDDRKSSKKTAFEKKYTTKQF